MVRPHYKSLPVPIFIARLSTIVIIRLAGHDAGLIPVRPAFVVSECAFHGAVGVLVSAGLGRPGDQREEKSTFLLHNLD